MRAATTDTVLLTISINALDSWKSMFYLYFFGNLTTFAYVVP